MASPKFAPALTLQSALGKLDFVGSAIPEVDGRLRMSLGQRRPVYDLPEGMSVETWRAVVLSISCKAPLRGVTFTCHFEAVQKGSGCSGECLEAWEWASGNRLVVIGTEDGERLASRVPSLGCAQEGVVTGDGHSISITLGAVPASKWLELHFVVAENPLPEPRDASAWFAVDCPHDCLR